MLFNKQVGGVILLSGYQVRERSGPALPLGQVPLVYLYQYTRDVAISSVVPDDHGGAMLGTEHLIGLGYRRIGFINGPYTYEATHLRLEGYRQALKAAGLPFDPGLVRNGEWQEDSGYELAQDLMRLSEPPDALFCTSDILAVGALDALHELGVRVPEDVAVLGFDNRPFAAHQRPPLTTVALPFYEMGKLAGELLIEMVQGASPEATIHRVPCHLVLRMSCKAPFGY